MSTEKDKPMRPATSGPQEELGAQDIDQLLGALDSHINSTGPCAQVVRKVTEKVGDELVDRHVKMLLIAIKSYRDRQAKYVELDKPNGCFYTKCFVPASNEEKFAKNETYTEDLVKLLASHKEILAKLRDAINPCLSPEATGKAYDALEPVLKELHIFW